MMLPGTLTILHTGMGDDAMNLKLAQTLEELQGMLTKIQEMIQRGYAVLAEVAPGEYQRVVEVDKEKQTYVVAGQPETEVATSASETPRRKRGRPRKHLPVKTTRAVAVGRSAGG